MNKTIVTLCMLGLLSASCALATRPPLPTPSAPRERLVVRKEFRVGAFDFGRTSSEDESEVRLREAVPAILLTQIQEEGRFAVYEGGNIRGPETLNETTASKFVDAYLSGTITSLTKSQICFDVRLSNAYSHEVLYATQACAQVTARDETVDIDREALQRLATDISRAVKKVGNGQVLSVDSSLIVIDKGADAGIIPGMVGYVVATGQTVEDPKVHDEVRQLTGYSAASSRTAGLPVIVGELYVVSVEKDFCVAVRISGSYILPEDTVYFK